MRTFLRSWGDDVLFLAGAGAVTRGVWLVLPAAGWIVAGFFCLAAAFLVTRVRLT